MPRQSSLLVQSLEIAILLTIVPQVLWAQQGDEGQRRKVAKVNARAERLLALDDAARREFRKSHPNVLPNPARGLPKPTAIAFDWCNLNKVSDAHRQRSEDCWANVATEALECSYLIRNGSRVSLSTQPILDHLKLGAKDIRGFSTVAAEYLLKTGTAALRAYPYTGKPAQPAPVQLSFRAVAWGYVAPDDGIATAKQLKEALLRHGPLAVNVAATPKFHAYRGGLFSERPAAGEAPLTDNHVVMLVGWDDTKGRHGAWKIKNTWGAEWGEQGFMWIEYGSNQIGRRAMWVRAASTYYSVPADRFASLVPHANPLPRPRPRAVAKLDGVAQLAAIQSVMSAQKTSH